MGWHVVRSFARMHKRQRLGYDMIDRCLQVPAHIGIGAFVDRQRRRRMLDKEMQKADANIVQLRNAIDDPIGNQMKTASHWRDCQLCLVPHW